MKLSIVRIFLIITLSNICYLALAQSDTVVVEKDPVIIEQKVYYSKIYKPSLAGNFMSFDYSLSPVATREFKHSQFNNITINDIVPQKSVSISYARQRNRVLLRGGIGVRTMNLKLGQTSYTKGVQDSIKTEKIDTISCYVLITPRDGLQHICETEVTTTWTHIIRDESRTSSESYIRSTHLRIPLSLGYTHFKNRWSLSGSLGLVTNILVGNQKQVQFYNKNLEKEQLDEQWFQTVFLEVNPEVSLGYNFDIGFGIYATYRWLYQITSPNKFTTGHEDSRSFIGLSTRYFF